MNYKNTDPDRVREMVAEGRPHLHFMCSLYRRQVARGKYDLYEHPAAALNWKEDVIEALTRHPMSKVVIADQCRYGLVTPSGRSDSDDARHEADQSPHELGDDGFSASETMSTTPQASTTCGRSM